MCSDDFYNDPTHVKPYTPEGLKNTFYLFGLNTIYRAWFNRTKMVLVNLPIIFKWKVASKIIAEQNPL